MATLPVYRRALARKVGGYSQITTGAQATPPSGAYAGKGNQTKAERLVASSDLAGETLAGQVGEIPASRFDGAYVYALTTLPEQRRISLGSLISYEAAGSILDAGTTTPVGYFYADRNFGAILPASTVVEIHKKLPVLDQLGVIGLHSWINKALSLMAVSDRISIPGVTGQYRYDLSAYPWLDDETQLIQAYSPETVTGQDPYPLPGGSVLRIDASTPLLIVKTPTATGSTFYADFYRPRSSWIKVANVWAESTVGLVNETDEATANTNALVNVAWYIICDAFVQDAPPGDRSDWEKKRERAAEIAYPHLKNQELQAQARLHASGSSAEGVTTDSTGVVRRQSTSRTRRGGWP